MSKKLISLRTLFFILPMIWRHKGVSLIVLLLGGGWYAMERHVRQNYVYAGVPQEQALSYQTFTRVFRSDGFLLGYSEWRANPLWVSYHLTPIGKKTHLKRPSRFQVDNRSLRRVAHDDYLRSGYDRGHMAPNYAISNLYGRSAQHDTFVMTNITPQRPKLNQKLWQRLEEVEADYFAPWFKDVWVLTGPIFDQDVQRLKSGVEIPDAFYKIYAVPPTRAGGKPKILAFVMPQTVKGYEPLDKFVTSVDDIEQRTGLDFFPELDDKLEAQVEKSKSIYGWRLGEVRSLKGRFSKKR